MKGKVRIVSVTSFTDETCWQKRCHGDEQHNFAILYLQAHVAEVSGATIRVTDGMLVTMENPAGIASVGTASRKEWAGNIFEGVLCRYVGFEASLESFLASDFFEVLVTAFPRSGIFTMVTFEAVRWMVKYCISVYQTSDAFNENRDSSWFCNLILFRTDFSGAQKFLKLNV